MATTDALLGEISEIIDCEHKTAKEELHDVFAFSVGTRALSENFIDFSKCKPVSEETYYAWSRRGEVEPLDIILAREAPVGGVGLVEAGQRVCLGQRTVLIRANQEKVDPAFLKYYLQSPKSQEWFLEMSSGTTVRHVNVGDIKKMPIKGLPDLATQTLVASVLKNLDKKISSNQLCFESLDTLAREIFRNWFIDFDPVKAKMAGKAPLRLDAETAALFPDAMEDSEIGEIPFGWRVVEAGEIASTTIGGLWGADDSGDGRSSSYYCLRGTDLDDLKGAGYAERTPVRWDKAENIGKRQSANNHVLIGGSGAGPVGKSLLWDSSIEALFDSPVIYSNFVKRFETSTQAEATFLYFLLQEMLTSGEIFEYVGGTSVPNLLDKTLLQSKIFALPPEPLLRVFDALYRAALQIKYSGQSRYLAQLRDALLPRLVSGELEIPDEMLAEL